MLMTIFSDGEQIKTIRHLPRDDAQKLINVINEVSLCTL